MPKAKPQRQQHRHYKTLIALVFCMTAGTFLLYGVATISPVTPLRSHAPRDWNRISIRAVEPGAERGFYHYRVDENGRTFKSNAWSYQQVQRGAPTTIHIILTTSRNDLRVTSDQANSLAILISNLRMEYEIAEANVDVESDTRGFADYSPRGQRRRRT